MPVQNVECQIAQLQIIRFLKGEAVSGDMVEQLEAHIGQCSECRAYLAERKQELLSLVGEERPSTRSSTTSKLTTKDKAVVATPPSAAKFSWKTAAYAGGLTVVLLSMSLLSRNPTSFLGAKVQADSDQPGQPLAAVSSEPSTVAATPSLSESPTIFIASQIEPFERGSDEVEPASVPDSAPITEPTRSEPEVTVEQAAPKKAATPTPKATKPEPKPEPKPAATGGSLRFYDAEGRPIDPPKLRRNLMKPWILIATFALSTAVFATDGPPPTDPQPKRVTVSARGEDVRSVIHNLFTQAGKDYVVEPGIRFVLYLSLNNVELDEALEIICGQASLEYKVQNGITFFTPKKAILSTKQSPVVERKAVPPPPKPLGKLPTTVLDKKFTTRLTKTPIRDVFRAISEQTKVKFDIHASVPNWKLDAFLIDTSVRYALDLMAKQAGLVYRFTDQLSIEISKPEPKPVVENHITVFKD